MISPFMVYLVMQLDSINIGVGILVVALFVTSVVSTMMYADGTFNDAKRAAKVLKYGYISTALMFVVCVMLPSSKTAAAMLLIPALTSDAVVEPLTREGRELYGLAKQALENYVEDAGSEAAHTSPESEEETEE